MADGRDEAGRRGLLGPADGAAALPAADEGTAPAGEPRSARRQPARPRNGRSLEPVAGGAGRLARIPGHAQGGRAPPLDLYQVSAPEYPGTGPHRPAAAVPAGVPLPAGGTGGFVGSSRGRHDPALRRSTSRYAASYRSTTRARS